MSDIAELERRVSSALDRIGAALERIEPPPQTGEDLAAALEAERVANAQLEARVAAIKQKQETQVAALEKEVTGLREALQTRDREVQRLRRVNTELRESNTALREANAEGLADAHLINKSMMAEVESLRSAATANRADIDEVLSTLEPLLKEAGNA